MSVADTNPMDAVISSLSTSFRQVPTSAIPPMLDCVLASTGILPSTLFASLLDSFPPLIPGPDVAREDRTPDSGQCNCLTSMVAALCHLLKKLGNNHGEMELFIWKCFVPLIKTVHTFEREFIDQVADSFFDVISTTNSWDVLGATVVPFYLRAVGLSLGMIRNEEIDVFEWDQGLAFQGLDSFMTNISLDKDCIMSLAGSFPLPVSCHILTLILDAARHSFHEAPIIESALENGYCNLGTLFVNLLWDLCNMIERLLLQGSEHRSIAISFLLPVIFKALISQCSLEVSVRGCKWKLSRSLFSLGSLERKDAYSVLSLYLSFFSCVNEREEAEAILRAEEFDVRAEREFWDEIKRGLVDEERLVRKQSLHVLKVTLQISGENQCHPDVSEKKSWDKNSNSHDMTKRALWAEKEATSLGVGKFLHVDSHLNSRQQWESFLLLYEMLEEYGTHLVEAAWSHQMTLLLQFCVSHDNFVSTIGGKVHQNWMENSRETFSWLAILWQLGFCHENPQVRCLIMQSFLGIEWTRYGDFIRSVPESFVLGPFIEALNDPVHHNDFGVKGVYTSRTAGGAARFLCQYTSYLNRGKLVAFLHNLASVCKYQSFGRAGLMCLAECIASASNGLGAAHDVKGVCDKVGMSEGVQEESSSNECPYGDKTDLLDVLRYVIESSKQHFNPNYRLRVCEKVLEATASVVNTLDVPVEVLLHFISTIPRELTDYGGSLRLKVQEWLLGCDQKCSASGCSMKIQLLKSLQDFPERFICFQSSVDQTVTVDDEDMDTWESEARRWARVLFLMLKEEHEFTPILMIIQDFGVDFCNNFKHFFHVKFLVLIISLVMEIQVMQERASKYGIRVRSQSGTCLPGKEDRLGYAGASIINKQLPHVFLLMLGELLSFANIRCSIFWSNAVDDDTTLPTSVRGKLGGPSQRRLLSSTTTAVLQAITSMRAVASISSWCAQLNCGSELNYAWIFLWDFFWKIVSSPPCDSENGAEVCLAAYEALAPVLKTLASTFSPVSMNLIKEHHKMLASAVEEKYLLDWLLLSFSQHVNNLLAVGVLARARRAVLLNCKWLCLESLLSIQCYALVNGLHVEDNSKLFSDAAVRPIFTDIVESLENAGEGSVLPMLRCVRLTFGLFAPGKSGSPVSSCNGVDAQMIWHLVRSSWILHVNSNKRRVASIAALLSSVLHASIFADESMHFADNGPGPLKWFIERVLEEGTKSPRTIRLAALQLTGLWLSHPRTIKYYMKELKLLTLYGSVAFDEDFEAELSDNHDARTEVSLLAQSPDPELTEAFINTELYARICVAVLFYKLADLANLLGSENESHDSLAVLQSGKLFLLELLDSTVNDKDLAKELYKKYSGIHRRKIRAWQMICVMSRFIDNDVVGQVTNSLHIALQRNNLPAVRQYLETFAINIYLKYPSLVGEQLVPILRDYDMRPQALSSYVFIAANVILHASEIVRSRHLDELLPPIIPLLTSHHHSLRGFTQLLIHQVFVKYFPPLECGSCKDIPLEKRGFEDLRSYLLKNPDCRRLRTSMEGYLDAYDPIISSSPAGIFINRVEEVEFECVPLSLMDEVLKFLNDARDDLRCSMAKDIVTIKNESLKIIDDPNCGSIITHAQPSNDLSLDFQKKVTLSKHEKRDKNSGPVFGNTRAFEQLLEIEKDDDLLDQSFLSRNLAIQKIRASRQQLILVASLIDRIPNLAGLARTCEVFRASGLAIADTSILRDKQFQLISVTAEKWVPIIEVPVNSVKQFLEKKKREGFSILGLEQTANSVPLDQYIFPNKTVLVLGREKEGIPVDIIHVLDACIEIPQLGVVRSLNVHVSGAIALWEYTRQQRSH